VGTRIDLDKVARRFQVGEVAARSSGAVAIAPLLNARRVRRMDIPATLRLVEPSRVMYVDGQREPWPLAAAAPRC
jgi:hypothetical protein